MVHKFIKREDRFFNRAVHVPDRKVRVAQNNPKARAFKSAVHDWKHSRY